MKIEEGCLAVFIGKSKINAGKTGTVGKYIGNLPGWMDKDLWEFSADMISNLGELNHLASENYLMRIDEYKEEVKEKALEIE